MNAEQPKAQWGQIVARAWHDEAFRQRLLTDPAAVLQEHGLEVPAGVQVRVVEDTHQVVHLTLPRKPAMTAEVSEEELASVAGGAGAQAGNLSGAARTCTGSGLPICI
jgi:hypothetical protein